MKLSEITQKSKGQILTKQFEQSHSFYFLISGSVNFSISLDDKNEEFSVGKSSKQFTPIGWSGFRSPNRYATTVRCEEDSVFIKWNHKNLEKFFEQEPGLGREFLLFIVKQSVDLLYQVCKQLVNYNNISSDVDFGKTAGSFGERENIIVPDATELIQKSSFFEIFPEKIVRSLSKLSEKRWYLSGDILFNQGEDTKGIDILAYGKVALCFQDKPNADIDDSTILGIVNRPGTIIGWRSLCPSLINETSAIATKDSVVYHISKKSLSKLIENNTDIAFAFAKRLLWLVSIRLRNARAGLISNSYEREILAISNLIDQNATQLSVNSRLHKLPHLLNNTLTLDDAFNLLFKIERDGNSLEKDLSVLCLDILGKVYKEYTFFEGLKHIYQSVTDAPKSLSHSEIRSMADKQFVGIFEQIPYVIKGWENLPDKPGNIFIYNHLLNHPYNTLPNDFQITLDSHFISSMILYRKYGESSIRVVRVPRADEYGHENYYDRLGHINVYTKESEILKESEFDKKIRREKFFKTAAEYVSNGINIALSPEGTSLSTDESPGHFKPGSFLLTEYIDPEPYIVPIAIANFDKRINQSVLVATIKKPFLLSEQLSSNKLNKTELNNFLSNYRDVFRGYVEEATQIALDAETKKINLKFFEKVDRDNLVIDKNLFERDIRVLEKRYKDKSKDSSVLYGSSTLRLWKNVSK
nr:cyclic nucleotide-binding domain-containing protein [Candidatus Dadabacteria bacterium]NIQ15910.1 cyclic nucleotide-binding domain-containing protein [Candidatus Dadabacteria bacterium]